MGLFNFGKKKNKQESESCCCGEDTSNASSCCGEVKEEKPACECGGNCDDSMSIKILGSGCCSCNDLEKSVNEALEELGLSANVEHITDFSKIAAYGVMSTPALIINEKVASVGKALKKDEIIKLLKA